MTRQEWQRRSMVLRKLGYQGSGTFHRPSGRPPHVRDVNIPNFKSEVWAWLRGKSKERPRRSSSSG